MGPTRMSCSAVAVAVLSAAAACGGGQVQAYGAPRAPVTQITNDDYQALLAKYVDENGRVDYARWKDDKADVEALDRYLSTLTNATPETRPDLFKSQTDKLSYWINLYNALVLREIVRRWPLTTVTEMVKSGKGFFYELEFVIGGQPMNLHDIENKILRAQFRDARIHFAMHCGSSSCPLLRRDAYDPQKLDAQLESASAAFVNDGKNVLVDEAKKQVVMSRIFQWYNDDFVTFTRQRTKLREAGVVDFALLYAKDSLAAQLRDAKARSYKVVFLDYDWNVDNQDGSRLAKQAPKPATGAPEPAAQVTEGVGKPVPDVAFALADGSGTWRPSSAKGKVLLLDFWATYCKPCTASFPKLQALQDKYKDSLVVVGISEDDQPKAVVPAFLKATGARFLVGLDPDHTAAGPPFKVSVMPTELIVDRNGVVRHRHEGLRDGEIDDVVKQVEDLLKEK